MTEPRYISTTDTAKLVRKLLKAKFPGVKFSVRSDKYAGGSSIRVDWTDGPTAKLVDAYVQPFAGSGFDGMIDYKYSTYSWLLADGRAMPASNRGGTEGQRGSVPGYAFDKPAPDAELVSFSADFIFTDRSYSDAARDRVLQAYAATWGDELAEAITAGNVTEFHQASAYQCDAPAPAPHMGDCYLAQMCARRMLPAYMPAA